MVKFNAKGGKGRGSSSNLDPSQKIKATIGWYNKHGGLSEQIYYKSAGTCLQAIEPHKALEILSGLEEKGATIKDPTKWLQKAASRYAPDLDSKLKKTLFWYNKHGTLQNQIHYESVKGPLSLLPVPAALAILGGLEEKGAEIRDPTNWIIGAVDKKLASSGGMISDAGQTKGDKPWQKGKSWPTDTNISVELDAKVVKTVQWYNKHGGLLEAIDLETVAAHLAQIDWKDALKVLAGLDGKGSTIHHPTKWIITAIQKTLGASS